MNESAKEVMLKSFLHIKDKEIEKLNILVAELQAQIESVKEEYQSRLTSVFDLLEADTQIEAELNLIKLKADTERYQWLIEQHWVQPEIEFRLDLNEGCSLEDYGAAIDKARKRFK